MKTQIRRMLAIAFLIISAAAAKADFLFTFTGSGVLGIGTLQGIDLGVNSGTGFDQWLITGGSGVFFNGSDATPITLISDSDYPNSMVSPSGTFVFDNLANPTAPTGLILDPDGLLFAFGSLELNLCGDGNVGPGNDQWADNSGNAGNGTFTFSQENSVVPEPETLWLMGTGLVGIAALLSRKTSWLIHLRQSVKTRI